MRFFLTPASPQYIVDPIFKVKIHRGMSADTRPLSAVSLKMTALVVDTGNPEHELMQIWRAYAGFWLSSQTSEHVVGFLTAMAEEFHLLAQEEIMHPNGVSLVKVNLKVLQLVIIDVNNNALPALQNTVFCQMFRGAFDVMQLLLLVLQMRRTGLDESAEELHQHFLNIVESLNMSMQLQSNERHVFETMQLANLELTQKQNATAMCQKARDAQLIKSLQNENKTLKVRTARLEGIINSMTSIVKAANEHALEHQALAAGP